MPRTLAKGCMLCEAGITWDHGTMFVALRASTDDLVTGLWCPRCMLPSGVEVTVVVCCEHGDDTGQRMRLRVCADCDEPLALEEGP